MLSSSRSSLPAPGTSDTVMGLGGCGCNHAHSASSKFIFLAQFLFLASSVVKEFQMSDGTDSDSGVSYH